MSRAVSQAEFARLAGVNRSTVTRWRQAGRLDLDHRGRVLVDESLARIQASAGGRTDVAERHAAQRGAALPDTDATPGATDAEDATDESGGGEDHTRTRLKAMAIHYANQQAKIQLALQRAQRYWLADVRQEGLTIGARTRAGIERLIDEIAPRLRLLDPAERQEALEKRCEELAQDTATEYRRAHGRAKSGNSR